MYRPYPLQHSQPLPTIAVVVLKGVLDQGGAIDLQPQSRRMLYPRRWGTSEMFPTFAQPNGTTQFNLLRRLTQTRCEFDSHADTCVAGPNLFLDEYTGDFCDVTPYSTEYQPLTNVPIVNASTALTDNRLGETLILWLTRYYGTDCDFR